MKCIVCNSIIFKKWNSEQKRQFCSQGCFNSIYHKDRNRKFIQARADAKQKQIHPEKIAARKKVWEAISKKSLKPGICSHCRSDKNIEAHHEDYSKPLEIIWLCRKCHKEKHNATQHRMKL